MKIEHIKPENLFYLDVIQSEVNAAIKELEANPEDYLDMQGNAQYLICDISLGASGIYQANEIIKAFHIEEAAEIYRSGGIYDPEVFEDVIDHVASEISEELTELIELPDNYDLMFTHLESDGSYSLVLYKYNN